MATNVNGSPGVNSAVPLPFHAGWRARGMGQKKVLSSAEYVGPIG